MIKLLQNIPLGYYAFSGLVNFLTAFVIFVIVFFSKKYKTNRIFAAFSFSVAYWSLLYFVWLISKSKEWAEFYLRSCMIGVLFMPSLFIHFVALFLNLKINKKFIATNYTLSILFASTIYTSLYAKDIGRHLVFPYWLHVGPVFHLALFHFGAIVLYSFYLMWQSIKKEKGIFRNQILYVFIGTAIGYISGVTNFFCWYRINIPPFLNIFVSVYVLMVAVAVLRYRLMDINIALTRAGIFAIVYTLVLGIPFAVAGWGKPMLVHLFGNNWFWFPLVVFFALATAGPFIFIYVSRRAEVRIQAEERRGRELLKQASEGMMRIRSIKRLVSLMVHVTCKILKLDNAAVFLLDEESGRYKLEAVRIRSRYRYTESLNREDALIQGLSTLEEPLVYEEVKSQAQQLKDKPDEPTHELESQMANLSASVIVPAVSRGQLLGFLVLAEKKSKRMYSKEDLSVLWVLSNQAALAIENAQFHKKAQEALLKEDREMTARFIGHGASHQFGNLLNRIIQHSSGKMMDIDDLDLNSQSPEGLKKLVLELREEFFAITKVSMQGNEIVSGILSMGAGSPVDFKQEDLKSIIQRAVQTIRLKQAKAQVQKADYLTEIIIEIDDNFPKIWCNSLQIEQIIDNLLDNALEAIEEKGNLIKYNELSFQGNFRGKIVIKAMADADRVFLEILDNGIGIKPENLKNMFTPFFTTKATERLSRKGHGIGMHTVKEIIKAHQGKIYVAHSEYGIGTTFMVEFPLKISENKKG